MKKMRRTISAALTFLMLLTFMIPSAAAFKNGDVVNYYLYTDIVTYINKIPIRSYNIDGYTAVVVEDLANYGFDVVWSASARTLSVTRNTSKRIIGGFEPGANTGKVGNRAGEVYFTDIITYFDGQAVKSYNIGGRTIAYVDDLAEFYKDAYVWDPYARTLSLTLRGAPPPPPPPASPLAITAQPKNVVANKGDAVSFEVTVKGGAAPYTYQWQVKQGSSGSWSNTTYTSRKMTFFVSDADLDNPNYYRCVIIDSESDTVTSESVSVSTAQSGTFTVTLPFETISVFSTETFTISVTENGGKAPYTYQWYHGTSLSNFTAIASTAKTISFKPDPAPTTQYLKCAVIDKNGTVAETAPLKITLKDLVPINPLTATLDPSSLNVYGSDNFSITCNAQGGVGSYTYEWEYGVKLSVFEGISYSKLSCTTKTYKGTGLGDGMFIILNPTYYRCIVTDSNGNVFETEPCKVNFYKTPSTTPLTATLDSESKIVLFPISFTITCEPQGGVGPYEYNWQVGLKTGNLVVYGPANCTTKTLNGSSLNQDTVRYYRCIVTDSKGNSAYSNVCTVTFKKIVLPFP